MAFEEVKPKQWEYKNEGDNITGVLIDVKEKLGPNKGTLYTLQLQDDSTIGVWGSTVLDSLMASIRVGQLIRITYLGVNQSSPQPEGKKPKMFRVEVDK